MAQRRNQRALAVIRALRSRQRRLNQQIEILCQDMVAAHGQFARKLARLTFVAGFYETLLGCGTLETLLDKAAQSICSRIPDAGVAVFLLEKGGFDIHIAAAPQGAPAVGRDELQQWFTADTAAAVALAGRVCSANRLLSLGMQAPPGVLKLVSLSAVPLGVLGCAVGFVLVWRSAENPIRPEQMETLAAAAAGLRAAVLAHRSAAADLKPKCLPC
ncbi:MAG TPA: hypothetical protein PKY88_10215 [Anaerohalosphaeraceae bacterium]|nr:hypothetical protein [Anaerohalosphaeraceae bacterium]